MLLYILLWLLLQYFMITHVQPNVLWLNSPNAGTPCTKRTNSKCLCFIFPERFALLHHNGCLFYCLCCLCRLCTPVSHSLPKIIYLKYWNTLRGNSAFFIVTFKLFFFPIKCQKWEKKNNHKCTLVQEGFLFVCFNFLWLDMTLYRKLCKGGGGLIKII